MDSEVNFSWEDGRKVCSILCQNEVLLNKKRRWLMGSMIYPSDDTQKRLIAPKFLSNKFLPESYLRTDDVYTEIIRRNIGKSFGLSGEDEVSHHVVQDYIQLFGMHKLESYSVNPPLFLKAFSSVINNLNNNALCHVANIVAHEKVIFEKKRPRMKKIIIKYLLKIFAESSSNDHLIVLKQLSQIFRNPSNFRKKQLVLLTPLSPSLLSSIHKVLEGLDEVPFQTLVAVNRKLKGVTVVPLFPPVIHVTSRCLLMAPVKKKCQGFLSKLEEGFNIPKPFAKALSVMRLSLKQKTRRLDILTSEFFPFPSEIVDLQNDILNALWSLEKIPYHELKALLLVLDPQAKVSKLGFRRGLKNYLMEYLFQCDDINIPEEVLHSLAFIKRKSRWWFRTCLEETREEETEAVLHVSSHLTQVVLNINRRIDEESASECSETLENDDGESNDFKLQGNDYCSNLDESKLQKLRESGLVEEETTGDSRPYASSIPVASKGKCDLPTVATSGNMYFNSAIKEPKLELGTGGNASHCCSDESMEIHPPNYLPVIQDVCDETSLFAYNLIGHLLDRFMQMKGMEIDALTRSYLRGGSSPPEDFQGSEASDVPTEDMGSLVLFQVVEDLLPSFPKSSIEKLKLLIGLP